MCKCIFHRQSFEWVGQYASRLSSEDVRSEQFKWSQERWGFASGGRNGDIVIGARAGG
jgi:hypothetical protein